MNFKVNRKTFLYTLIYISLGFLVLKLYQANYLKIPIIKSYTALIVSFIFLFIGMVANTLNWRAMLSQNKVNISIKDAITSVGLCIFTKYIPGKVLMILGRAEYISQRYNVALKLTSVTSLQTQFLSLLVGVFLGCFALGFLEEHLLLSYWFQLTLGLFLLLSAIVFLPIVKLSIEKIYLFFTKKTINIPHISVDGTIKAVPYFLSNWIFWSISFYFLIIALSTNTYIPITSGLSFALGGTIGILAIIAPGGLGVREAVLTYCLNLAGLELTEATTIAVASRLWFLVGEGFIFSLAVALKQKKKTLLF